MNFISTFSVLAENKLEEYVKIIFCDCDIHYTQAHIIYSQGVYLSFKVLLSKKSSSKVILLILINKKDDCKVAGLAFIIIIIKSS